MCKAQCLGYLHLSQAGLFDVIAQLSEKLTSQFVVFTRFRRLLQKIRNSWENHGFQLVFHVRILSPSEARTSNPKGYYFFLETAFFKVYF